MLLLETCISLRFACPPWHHSHYLPVCMLLLQFSSHWAANNLKQQGYSLTVLSGESPCLSPADLSPASEAEQVYVCDAWTYAICVCVCVLVCIGYRWLHQRPCDGKAECVCERWGPEEGPQRKQKPWWSWFNCLNQSWLLTRVWKSLHFRFFLSFEFLHKPPTVTQRGLSLICVRYESFLNSQSSALPVNSAALGSRRILSPFWIWTGRIKV